MKITHWNVNKAMKPIVVRSWSIRIAYTLRTNAALIALFPNEDPNDKLLSTPSDWPVWLTTYKILPCPTSRNGIGMD